MWPSSNLTRSQTATWSTRPSVQPAARDRSSPRTSVMRSKRRNKARGRSPVATRSSQRFHKAGNNSKPESPLSGFGSIAFHCRGSVQRGKRVEVVQIPMQQTIIDPIRDQFLETVGAADQESPFIGIGCQPNCIRRASQSGRSDIAETAQTCWRGHRVELHQQLRDDLGGSKIVLHRRSGLAKRRAARAASLPSRDHAPAVAPLPVPPTLSAPQAHRRSRRQPAAA